MREQTKHPITEDSCPWCGAEYQLGPHRDGKILFDEDLAAVEPVKCHTCGAKWFREYSIEFRNIRFLQEHPFSHDMDKFVAEWPQRTGLKCPTCGKSGYELGITEDGTALVCTEDGGVLS